MHLGDRRFLVNLARVPDGAPWGMVSRGEPTGIRRHGSPLVDLCDQSLLGISLGGDDQVPEAICIEPRRPLLPESMLEWGLDAPDGVELLQVTDFVRDDCPGLSTLEQTRWFSTHYFKLRNTGEHDFEDFTVRVLTDEDKRLVPRRDVYSFADSDVWAWRVRVTEGTPVKVVVTVR